MRNLIVNFVYKNFILEKIVDLLRGLNKKLGPDNAKTILGIITVVLAMVSVTFPIATPFISPLIEVIEPMAGEVAAGGLAYTALGLFDKALKWVKAKIEAHK